MYFNSQSWKVLKKSTDTFKWSLNCIKIRGISKKTHYETLKLSKNCSSSEIRDAFIALSKQYHPDCNQNDPKAKEQFVEISEAYNVLIKPSSRKEYDFTLHHFQGPSRVYRPPNPHDNYEIHRYDSHKYNQDPMKDPSFARNRNLRKDWSENYYGVKGFPKVPNQKIVYYVGVFLVVGLIIQLFLISAYRRVTRQSEEKYYEANKQQLQLARARADTFLTREKQIEELRKRLEPQDED